ncbi:MAG: magnesium transporter [Actinobacteria bacterium]|nr:magnesium transporter [Actinomycetota bacterium]
MAATRVFAARVNGMPVISPKGEPIGKVRDIVVTLRLDRQPPRALGIVVELPDRRTIFVPMGRVVSIDAHGVTLSTGSVNLRGFEQRPAEALLIGQVIGARVRIATTATAATVVDTRLDQNRSRDWLVTQVAVREHTRPFARRAPVQVLGWSDIRGLTGPEILGTLPRDMHALIASFEGLKPADVANVLHDLSPALRKAIAASLSLDRLADIVEELSESDQTELLGSLEESRAADVLEAMDPDDAADLLGELPSTMKDRLLELMEPEESEPVKRLLKYSSDTAGGLMTTDPVVLTPDATFAEALARVRNEELTPALASMVFVCRPPQSTPTGQYIGCVHIQRLLRDAPFELVAGAVDRELPRLSEDASLTEVTRFFATYNLVCAPVVDDEGHLLGAVSVDDVLDHLLPSNWRTMSLGEMPDAGTITMTAIPAHGGDTHG